MSFLTLSDLGTYSGSYVSPGVYDVGGSVSYPADMRPGTLVVFPGGQAPADTFGGGPMPTSGDHNGNVFTPHVVGGLGIPAFAVPVPAAYYYSGVLSSPAPAGVIADATDIGPSLPLPGSIWWNHGQAVLGAEGWVGAGSSGNSYSGYPDPDVPPQPLSVPSLGPMSSPGGLVVVQSGAAIARPDSGGPFGAGADFVTSMVDGYTGAIYGSVTLYGPDEVWDGEFSLPVDDGYTWAAQMVVFAPRFYQSGNVISLAKRLGRIGRAVQRIVQTGNLVQPDFSRKVETLGDDPHDGSGNLQVGARCWSLSLGCRGSKRWDLFACREEASNGNLISPIAEVIHQQSGDDITSWSDPETLLTGRYHSLCHVLDGHGRLVLALWDDAEKKWYLSVGSSGDGKGDWTMSEPRLLVDDAQGQASLRRDGDGRYWFACVTAGTWSATAETDSGFLRLLRCDAIGPGGEGEWDDIPVDDEAVGGGYTGVNFAIKSRGLFVFHLFRRSVTRSIPDVPLGGSTEPGTWRCVASFSHATDPNELVFTEPVAPVLAPSDFSIQPLGPGDLLLRGDGSFYWAYQDTGPIKQRVLAKVLPDGSGVVT